MCFKRHFFPSTLNGLGTLIKSQRDGVPVVVQQKQIHLGTMRFRARSLASLSGLRIHCCRELWCRSQTWLESCIAVVVVCTGRAVALIQPLAWELTYVTGMALKSKKKKKKKISMSYTNGFIFSLSVLFCRCLCLCLGWCDIVFMPVAFSKF